MCVCLERGPVVNFIERESIEIEACVLQLGVCGCVIECLWVCVCMLGADFCVCACLVLCVCVYCRERECKN